jgi:hypothetical protein
MGIVALDNNRWTSLSHAYGPAADIPELLNRAKDDPRPGHVTGSAWFDLWSALCHQGDAYTASYAALPHLVVMATPHLQRQRYDAILLAACIELARLDGRGPSVPDDISVAYHAAVREGLSFARANVAQAWDIDSRNALEGSAAAFSGDVGGAHAILDADED